MILKPGNSDHADNLISGYTRAKTKWREMAAEYDERTRNSAGRSTRRQSNVSSLLRLCRFFFLMIIITLMTSSEPGHSDQINENEGSENS